ncbi:hypothetical protein [Brumimicrobium aurantiacum]|uniref:Uncharacterized protein n=1 Tax=Brumimicrobium aurantiacum TaxID=1737063 RepID=A0A3E1F1B9_9FLAO|nr:hypothetical protein [Brumimicrobium aurantiacum]RFC55622.1 hypothetical protein DXU93_01435 [Brumimicrobium aurantiacum]
MKKKLILGAIIAVGFSFTSCEKCAECHYDGPNGEVELGEYCGDDLEDIEDAGMSVNGEDYEVHCHDH